jgi:hypothetical protein
MTSNIPAEDRARPCFGKVWLKDSTGSFETGLYAMAGCALISAIVTLIAVQAPPRRVEPTGLSVAAA